LSIERSAASVKNPWIPTHSTDETISRSASVGIDRHRCRKFAVVKKKTCTSEGDRIKLVADGGALTASREYAMRMLLGCRACQEKMPGNQAGKSREDP
jgi:hypothetical protein